MKNKCLLLTWLLAVPLLWGGCDKPLFQPNKDNTEEPEELPPITTTGENTFGCLVNGEVWLPAGPDRYNRGFDEGTGYFLFWAVRRFNNFEDNEMIGLSGKVLLSDPASVEEVRITYSKNIEKDLSFYESDSSFAKITFQELDTEQDVAAGSFEGFVINENPPFDTIRITQGRFDFNY